MTISYHDRCFYLHDQSILYLHTGLKEPGKHTFYPYSPTSLDGQPFLEERAGTAGGHSQGWGWGEGRPGTRFLKNPGR